MQLEGRFWLDRGGKPFLGPGRVALLERIDACRSIAEAARAMGMGYKTAWDLVDAMNQLAEQPLVVRVKGGRQGGGTELTDYGRSVVATFRALERDYVAMLETLGARYPGFGAFDAHPRPPRLRTSARNQWSGHVTGIERRLETLSRQSEGMLRPSNSSALPSKLQGDLEALLPKLSSFLDRQRPSERSMTSGVPAALLRRIWLRALGITAVLWLAALAGVSFWLGLWHLPRP